MKKNKKCNCCNKSIYKNEFYLANDGEDTRSFFYLCSVADTAETNFFCSTTDTSSENWTGNRGNPSTAYEQHSTTYEHFIQRIDSNLSANGEEDRTSSYLLETLLNNGTWI